MHWSEVILIFIDGEIYFLLQMYYLLKRQALDFLKDSKNF